MKPTRFLGLALAVIALAVVIQTVVLAPVSGHPDRGVLPPIDQQAPSEPR